MKLDNLTDSLGRLDDDFLDEVQTLKCRKSNRRQRWYKGLAVAACMVFIIGTTLTVEATSGSVSNLLAPLFGVAQTELVDQIGLPVGVSATSNGYTMSVDAVIGDRYNVAIVYTLTRDDGLPIPNQVCFRNWHTNAPYNSGGGGSLHPIYDADQPNQVKFVESWSLSSPLIGRFLTATFSDLMVYEENSQYTLLTEGTWKLSYTLRYPDSSVKLPVKNMQIVDKAEKKYQLDKGVISPIGLHIEGKLLEPVWGEQNAMREFPVVLLLSDGSEILLEDCTRGISLSEGDSTADCHFEAMFPEPIPLESIQTLIICDTEIKLK